MRKYLILPLMFVTAITAGIRAATAESSDDASEAAILDSVTVNAADALATVAAKNTGKVVELVLLSEGGTAVYQVTTLKADGVETNYAVDAKTGAIVATVDIRHDDEDENRDDESDNESKDGESDD